MAEIYKGRLVRLIIEGQHNPWGPGYAVPPVNEIVRAKIAFDTHEVAARFKLDGPYRIDNDTGGIIWIGGSSHRFIDWAVEVGIFESPKAAEWMLSDPKDSGIFSPRDLKRVSAYSWSK